MAEDENQEAHARRIPPSGSAGMGSAPMFKIPNRDIVAVEHPMIIINIDEGLRTFGTTHVLENVSDVLWFFSVYRCDVLLC
jgi:hypothetical protein